MSNKTKQWLACYGYISVWVPQLWWIKGAVSDRTGLNFLEICITGVLALLALGFTVAMNSYEIDSKELGQLREHLKAKAEEQMS